MHIADQVLDRMLELGMNANEADARAVLKVVADFVEDFSWTIPLRGDPTKPDEWAKFRAINEATDDAACSVCDQIAAALRNNERETP